MPLTEARRAEAVDVAKEIFWTSGYADASIAEIVKATGLNRYALYSEFGGKRELFLAALDRYYNQCGEKYFAIIGDRAVPPMTRVENVMTEMIEDMAAEDRGCLMCQHAVEVAREDPVIAAAVADYFSQICDGIEAPIREAAEAGALNPNLSSRQAAQIVFDAKMSIGVYARAGADRAQLDRIVAATLAAIRR